MADSKNQCCLRAKAKWEMTDFTRCSSKQSNNLKNNGYLHQTSEDDPMKKALITGITGQDGSYLQI